MRLALICCSDDACPTLADGSDCCAVQTPSNIKDVISDRLSQQGQHEQLTCKVCSVLGTEVPIIGCASIFPQSQDAGNMNSKAAIKASMVGLLRSLQSLNGAELMAVDAGRSGSVEQ